jgi:hypothetical protein
VRDGDRANDAHSGIHVLGSLADSGAAERLSTLPSLHGEAGVTGLLHQRYSAQ